MAKKSGWDIREWTARQLVFLDDRFRVEEPGVIARIPELKRVREKMEKEIGEADGFVLVSE